MDQIDDTDFDGAVDEDSYSSARKNKKNSKKETPKTKNVKNMDVEAREQILLAQLIHNHELFVKGITFLEVSFFESKINKLIVTFIKDYYEKYKSIPPEDAILVDLSLGELSQDWLSVSEQWPTNYLEDYLNAFIKNMSMKNAIEDSIELLEVEDYGAIEKKIKDAVNVDIDVKLGMTIESDSFSSLFDMLTSQEATIPSGWSNVDERLEGGVTVPSLNYILAKSGGGKCCFFTTLLNIKISKTLYEKIKMV